MAICAAEHACSPANFTARSALSVFRNAMKLSTAQFKVGLSRQPASFVTGEGAREEAGVAGWDPLFLANSRYILPQVVVYSRDVNFPDALLSFSLQRAKRRPSIDRDTRGAANERTVLTLFLPSRSRRQSPPLSRSPARELIPHYPSHPVWKMERVDVRSRTATLTFLDSPSSPRHLSRLAHGLRDRSFARWK